MTDPRVVNEFRKALRDTGASAKIGVALFASGIVESGLRNLNYGDRDSRGALQQRPSQGWQNASNPYRAAIDFINHARPIEHQYGNPAHLAQAVQRSAFPDRYGKVLREASSFVSGRGGGGGSRPGVGGSSQPGVNAQNGFDPGSGAQGLSALLAAATAPQQTAPPVTLRPAPAFAAAPPMPAGYQGVQSSAPPAPKPTIDPAQLQALTDLTLPKIQQVQVGGGGGGSAGAAPTGRRGQVLTTRATNRPGVGLSGELKNFVSLVAGRARQPITITTGTNHSRLTVDGNVSDHWDGHAADIGVPIDSAQGDHIASAALQAAGVPKVRAMQMARQGGLFNVNYRGHRVQVIWRTNEGGNHHNHVHIGIR